VKTTTTKTTTISDGEKQKKQWEMVHGKLAWEGAFAPENLTYEALGNDPTSGNPDRISKAALFEGYPNITFASNDAAWFMIEQVRKYPGQVSIYSAGALTNIALAVRMDPTFAKNAKELVIMVCILDWSIFAAGERERERETKY
jgi:transcription antitermination factor NusG